MFSRQIKWHPPLLYGEFGITRSHSVETYMVSSELRDRTLWKAYMVTSELPDRTLWKAYMVTSELPESSLWKRLLTCCETVRNE